MTWSWILWAAATLAAAAQEKIESDDLLGGPDQELQETAPQVDAPRSLVPS
jgi:hypothetical protein